MTRNTAVGRGRWEEGMEGGEGTGRREGGTGQYFNSNCSFAFRVVDLTSVKGARAYSLLHGLVGR